jgi:hypothetical protein
MVARHRASKSGGIRMSSFSVKWIYVLDEDFSYNIKAYLPDDFTTGCRFEDRNGNCWLEIQPDGTATVFAPYAWDGCTPKFSLWDILVGTPDGMTNTCTKKPKTYYASLMHDALCQFLEASPVTRRNADRIFLELMTRDNFAPRFLYYAVVRLFGSLSHIITRRVRRYKGRKTALLPQTSQASE